MKVFKLILLILSVASCRHNSIVGHYWTIDDEIGYMEWTFSDDYLIRFDGTVFSPPYYYEVYGDSVSFDLDRRIDNKLYNYKLIRFQTSDSIFFVDFTDTIKFYKLPKLDVFYNAEMSKEEQDYLHLPFSLRRDFLSQPKSSHSVDEVRMD